MYTASSHADPQRLGLQSAKMHAHAPPRPTLPPSVWSTLTSNTQDGSPIRSTPFCFEVPPSYNQTPTSPRNAYVNKDATPCPPTRTDFPQMPGCFPRLPPSVQIQTPDRDQKQSPGFDLACTDDTIPTHHKASPNRNPTSSLNGTRLPSRCLAEFLQRYHPPLSVSRAAATPRSRKGPSRGLSDYPGYLAKYDFPFQSTARPIQDRMRPFRPPSLYREPTRPYTNRTLATRTIPTLCKESRPNLETNAPAPAWPHGSTRSPLPSPPLLRRRMRPAYAPTRTACLHECSMQEVAGLLPTTPAQTHSTPNYADDPHPTPHQGSPKSDLPSKPIQPHNYKNPVLAAVPIFR